MISDLHIGDSTKKDNLSVGRERLLHLFLDYVDKNDGELIILGDFLELWKYRLSKIISKRRGLLDRLAGMDMTYIPGNHDADISDYMLGRLVPHKFLEKIRTPFVKQIGDTSFKFVHGHEVDPFIPEFLLNFGKIFGSLAGRFQIIPGQCILSNDAVSDACLEMGEHLLNTWKWFAGKVGLAIREYYSFIPPEHFNKMQRSVRTRKMLIRYHRDLRKGLYDKAIVAHTHKAGSFDGWYHNCGSWTGTNHNYLIITPDGKVSIFDWSSDGPKTNKTKISIEY